MDENNEVKVENSNEVTHQDYNEVKVQDSDEVIVQDFNTIKAEDSNEIKIDNNDIVQDATISNGIESNSYTYQENNEIKVENNNESQNKRKSLIIVAIILALILLGLVGYFVYDKFFKNKTTDDHSIESKVYYTKEYYDLDTVKKERITREEFASRIKKYNATCGLTDIKDNKGKKLECYNADGESFGDDSIFYIDGGVPYHMTRHADMICEGNVCNSDDEHSNLYAFSEIKNVKQIASRVSKYSFAYELDNGDVYYFIRIPDDEIEVDGVKRDTHLLKLNLPAKLKRFSNVESIRSTKDNYGTEIVVELENDEKYVVEYDHQYHEAILTKYDEYIQRKNSKEAEIEVKDIGNVELSENILEAIYFNSIIENTKFIKSNSSEKHPSITINKYKYIIKSIDNPSAVLYANNDGSDGGFVDAYILDKNNNLYHASFATRSSYALERNMDLSIYKYNIDKVDSYALIIGSSEEKMLDGEDCPVPYNYVIFKTKDGKYYTDYVFDMNNGYPPKILRQVIQKLPTENEKVIINNTYTYGSYKITFNKYDGGGDTSKLIVKNSKNKVLYENDEIKTFIGEELEENKPYIENGKLYFTALSNECFKDENGDSRAYIEYYSIDLNSSTIKASLIKKTKDYIEGNVGKCEISDVPISNISSVKCGENEYNFSNDSVNEVKEGTGWSDGSVEIKYELSDKKLMYTLNEVTKQLNDLSCEKLFKYDNGSLSRSNDTNAIAAGICYTGSKYYEIGLTVDPSVGDRPIQATDFIPYADDITSLCK